MISAGNDIIALNAINITRTNQLKFYSKILSETEIPLYNEFSLAGIPFEIFVWLLWSVKESAYKFLQRHDAALIFTPVKFVVTGIEIPIDFHADHFGGEMIEGTGFGTFISIMSTVKHNDHTLYSRSVLNDQFIHSAVNDTDEFDQICWGVKVIDSTDHITQSKEVRLFLLQQLQQMSGMPDLTIAKNSSGCPVLIKDKSDFPIPISLSHHGCFVGYSFLMVDL